MQCNVCSVINKAFAENAALSFLADNESFSGYQRKRLAQSFEQQVETPRSKKRHISNSFLEQYKDIVMEKVRQWPANKTLTLYPPLTSFGVKMAARIFLTNWL